MTRRERIAEHLDALPAESLYICTAKGSCACKGCAGSVNGTRIREHELRLYFDGNLFEGQKKRSMPSKKE